VTEIVTSLGKMINTSLFFQDASMPHKTQQNNGMMCPLVNVH